ncbi:hypothetical protein LZ906_004435 [Paraclostridium ghonii]|uniref:hypothetical protein n=1 Tax=Paraclostridium ghonii TaxID=29358 RepID=UPI00202CDD81|nr:hypothetical protein [Paeniclostridium ghonii]MCM0167481.1 hypothetical protein [Paeniclostridium ghonii]
MNIDKLSIENVTGKTHVLKFIYSICKNISRSEKDLYDIAEQFFKVDPEKLIRNSEKKCAKVHLNLFDNNVNFKIEKKKEDILKL